MFRNYRLVETVLTWPDEGQIDEFLTIVDSVAPLSLTVHRENTVEAAMSNGWRFPKVERISSSVLRISAWTAVMFFNLDANIRVYAGGRRRRRSYIERNRVTSEEVFCKWIDFTMCQFMISG